MDEIFDEWNEEELMAIADLEKKVSLDPHSNNTGKSPANPPAKPSPLASSYTQNMENTGKRHDFLQASQISKRAPITSTQQPMQSQSKCPDDFGILSSRCKAPPTPEKSRISTMLKLDDQQKAAVESDIHTPLMITAGPGSGKTSTLVGRVIYLLSCKVPPSQILAFTFTRKACTEMIERINLYVPQNPEEGVVLSTFHQWCYRLIRLHGSKLGYKKWLKVFTQAQQIKIVKTILDSVRVKRTLFQSGNQKSGMDGKRPESTSSSSTQTKYTPEDYLKMIRKAKSDLKEPNKFRGDFAEIYQLYQEKMQEKCAIDFSDFHLLAIKLLQTRQDVLRECRSNHRYILVDEFQDTSSAQLELLKLVVGTRGSIGVVGDDDQSIYGFRGASFQNFSEFRRAFGGHHVLLERNYRSTSSIVEAMNAMISNNQQRDPKVLWTSNPPGSKISVCKCLDGKDEVSFVTSRVLELIRERKSAGQSFGYSDISILFRTKRVAYAFEVGLRSKGIPTVLPGNISFYSRSEVADILGYLRLLTDDNDDYSFRRICNSPKRNMGKTTVEEIENVSKKHGLSLYQTCQAIAKQEQGQFNTRQLNAIEAFVSIIETFREEAKNLPIGDLIVSIVDKTCYIEKSCPTSKEELTFEEAEKSEDEDDQAPDVSAPPPDTRADSPMTPEKRHRMSIRQNLFVLKKEADAFYNQNYDAIEKQIQSASSNQANPKFIALRRFLSSCSPLDGKSGSDTKTKNAVTICTVHQAKGLQWPVVFLVRFNDGVMPLTLSSYTSGDDAMRETQKVDLEEERRLAYVALSRAKEKLWITFASKDERSELQPSRFLFEIPSTSLELYEQSPGDGPRSLISTSIEVLQTSGQQNPTELTHLATRGTKEHHHSQMATQDRSLQDLSDLIIPSCPSNVKMNGSKDESDCFQANPSQFIPVSQKPRGIRNSHSCGSTQATQGKRASQGKRLKPSQSSCSIALENLSEDNQTQKSQSTPHRSAKRTSKQQATPTATTQTSAEHGDEIDFVEPESQSAGNTQAGTRKRGRPRKGDDIAASAPKPRKRSILEHHQHHQHDNQHEAQHHTTLEIPNSAPSTTTHPTRELRDPRDPRDPKDSRDPRDSSSSSAAATKPSPPSTGACESLPKSPSKTLSKSASSTSQPTQSTTTRRTTPILGGILGKVSLTSIRTPLSAVR